MLSKSAVAVGFLSVLSRHSVKGKWFTGQARKSLSSPERQGQETDHGGPLNQRQELSCCRFIGLVCSERTPLKVVLVGPREVTQGLNRQDCLNDPSSCFLQSVLKPHRLKESLSHVSRRRSFPAFPLQS